MNENGEIPFFFGVYISFLSSQIGWNITKLVVRFIDNFCEHSIYSNVKIYMYSIFTGNLANCGNKIPGGQCDWYYMYVLMINNFDKNT